MGLEARASEQSGVPNPGGCLLEESGEKESDNARALTSILSLLEKGGHVNAG